MAVSLMSSDTLQMQLQSARKSILFLETQHADTLRALQTEIKELKSKCSKLTFQLAMNEATQARTDEDKRFEDIIRQQNIDIENLTNEKVFLLQQAESKDKQIVAMEEDCKIKEVKYMKNSQILNHKIMSLLNEADSRATTIVYLQSELSKARRKMKNFAAGGNKQVLSSDLTMNQPKGIHPTPPPYPSTSRRPGSSTSSVSDQYYLENNVNIVSRPTSGQRRRSSATRLKPVKVNGDVHPQPMPDPTMFFQAHDTSQQQDKLPYEPRPPSVLPPIRKSSLVSSEHEVGSTETLHGSGSQTSPKNVDIVMQANRYSAQKTRYSAKQLVQVHHQPTSSAKREMVVTSMTNRMSPERKVQEG